MRVRGTLLLLVVALATTAALWWFGAGDDAAPPRSPEPSAAATEESPAAPAAASLTAATATATNAEPPNEQRTAGATPPKEAAMKNATIRGRCVDEAGTPIAGCTIKVRGFPSNSGRMEAWLRDHPKPESKEVEQTTGADGRFAIEFWPPPPFQFLFEAGSLDHVPLRARWGRIAEGASIDVGDATMARGIQVHGIVVDEADKAVEKAHVMLRNPGRDRRGFDDGVLVAMDGQAHTDSEGRFRCRHPVAPGPYEVSLGNDDALVKPVRGAFELARPIEELRIVVRSRTARSEIRGKVVDAAGQPIAGAWVEVQDAGRTGDISRRDGTFALRNERGPTVPVTIAASHAAHEPARSTSPVAWGSTDVVLTMERGGDLAVFVFDEAQHALTDFTVRTLPRDTGRFSSSDAEIRARGPFAEGFASIGGIGRGKWTVVVEFPSKERRTTLFAPIEVSSRDPLRVDLRAPRDVQQVVRVVDGGGAPIVGSQVQLCVPYTAAFDDNSAILEMERFWWSTGNKALLVETASTDADGRATLTGPPDRDIAVCANGPGHVPVRVWPVRWTSGPELTVTVARGARLHGRVGPPEALAEMRRLADDQADSTKGGIQLRRGTGGGTVRLPAFTDGERFAIDENGAFSIEGLPPGEWNVAVTYHLAMDRGAVSKSLPVGTVVLRDGEATRFDPDATAILPGTVTGTVSKNGVPCSETKVQLEGWMPGQTEKHATDNATVTTDSAGRFTATVRPGAWRALLRTSNERGRWSTWRAAETATVAVGQTMQQDFTIWTGTVTVKLLSANGEPAANVDIDARYDGTDQQAGLPATDESGAAAAEVNTGILRLRVLPRRLQSKEARAKLWQESNEKQVPYEDLVAPLWIDLGKVLVDNSTPGAVELRLPPAFEK